MNTNEKEFLTYIGVIEPEKVVVTESIKVSNTKPIIPEVVTAGIGKSFIYISQGTINQCIMARVGWYNPCPVVTTICKTFNTHRHITISNKYIKILNKKYKIPANLEKFTTDWYRRKEVKPFSLELIPLENT